MMRGVPAGRRGGREVWCVEYGAVLIRCDEFKWVAEETAGVGGVCVRAAFRLEM